jgi:Outer membrane protein beta-barrel domain
MRRFLQCACAAGLLAVAATPARADGFITPYWGFNFGGDSANCVSLSNCEDKRTNWGVSFGATHGIFGFEEDIGYAKDFFGKTPGTNNAVLTIMSDFMLVVPAGPIQPYAVAGIGLIRPHFTFDTSSLSFDQNTLGYDIGAGLNIFLGHSVGVRGDVRHLHTLQDVNLGVFANSKLDFWRGSVGLTLRF